MTQTNTDRRALRLRIARALGYEIRGAVLYYLYHNDKCYPTGYLNESVGWARVCSDDVIPNWPADDGAALALCRKIGARHNYELVFNPELSPVTVAFQDARSEETALYLSGATPAEALVRLALAALEGGDDA